MATRKGSSPSQKGQKGKSSKRGASLSSPSARKRARAEAIAKAKAAAAAASTPPPPVTTKKQPLKDSVKAAVAKSIATAKAAAAAEAAKVALTPPAERNRQELEQAYEESKKKGRIEDIRSTPPIRTKVHGEHCIVKQIAFGFILDSDNFEDVVAQCVDAMEEVRDLLKAHYTTRTTIRYWTTFEWLRLGVPKGDGKSPDLEWKVPNISQRVHRFFTGHPAVPETKYEKNVVLKLQAMLDGVPAILLLAQVGGRPGSERKRRKRRSAS